ncbi:MAG: hypothetical protein ACSLEZ_00865 [Thiobacillus sp.]
MASATEWQQLRDDLGYTATTLTDVQAEAVFVQAASLYSEGALQAGARVVAIRQLLGSSARLHDYVQNNSSESASQVFKNLQALLGIWVGQAATDDMAERGSAARFGRTSRKPARIKEHPA